MHNKPLILALALLATYPCALLTQEKPETKAAGADERIGVTVERVERVDVFPEAQFASGVKFRPPDSGKDYVLVHLSIVSKKDLKVGLMEFRMARPNSPHLTDDRGEKYWAFTAQYNTTRGPEPLGEGGYVAFQVPKQVTPVQLRFVYPYRDESERSKKINYGQIDIDITHVR